MFAKTQVAPARRRHRQTSIRRHVDRLPSGTTAAENLLAVFAQATEEEFSAGRVWYSERAKQACDDIRTAAETVGLTLSHRQAAGIIAALSPSTGWGANVAAAFELVLTGNAHVQSERFNDRARRIMNGEDPESVLGGRKVRSFYRNILEPSFSGPVTVDRHAVAILFGRHLNEREIKVLEGMGAYTYAAGVYRSVARRLGVKPHELQAIVWQTWRRLKGIEWRDAFDGEVF